MGMAGAQAFGDMLLVNKTIQTLDVSDNSFGKMQVGDQVKIKSSGETKEVIEVYSDGVNIKYDGSGGWKNSGYEWESQVPAFCAGVAASPSLRTMSRPETVSNHRVPEGGRKTKLQIAADSDA